MLVSYNWLKSYADFALNPEELSVLLTNCGLETEALERYESVRGGLKGIITGRVLSCKPHPNADKLTLTLVDTGHEKPLPIICGAPNVSEDQKVLVAQEGATLYFNKKELQIKATKIRGEVSQGMICAEDELGLSDSHDGIMVLPADTPVGIPATDVFDVYNDWIFEVGLTPNRIDAASHIGVARDIVAVINHRQKRKALAVNYPDVSDFKTDNNSLKIPVTIEDPDACRRYSSLTISGVTVKESPKWLKNRLKAIGQKPINNVVDITNFVLHETGQPLHAFDANAVKGDKVIVKKSPENTVFITLDKEVLSLSGHDLMICNAEEPMCMGGILGGIGSGVTEKTTRIFLESACFSPVTIRKSSHRHGIKTDASYRFERGSDPEITVYALKRAAMLIKEVAGGEITSDVDDVVTEQILPAEVALQYDLVHKLIGKTIPAGEIKAILEDLDIRIVKETDRGLTLSPPAYRVDVTRPADIIEEILRIYGYNNVEVPDKMHTSLVISPKPDKELILNTISDMLSARGFTEIMNNSLTKPAYYQNNHFKPESLVHIVNPLSQDLSVMRQTLLFGGLESIAYNINRKVSDLKLYEFGKVYQQAIQPETNDLPYHEREVLELFMTGRSQPETWLTPDSMHHFFDIKNSVHAILTRMGVPEQLFSAKPIKNVFPYTYASEVSTKEKALATYGKLSQKILKDFDIKQDIYHACIDWETLVQLSAHQHLVSGEVSKFPAVRRDLALLIDADVSFGEIKDIAFKTGKKILQEVNLFDVYQDEKLGRNKKSYAVSFLFQDNKTLTDKEVDRVMDKLTQSYAKIGASLR